MIRTIKKNVYKNDSLAVNKSFKAKIRKLWEDWILEGFKEFTKGCRMTSTGCVDIFWWISNGKKLINNA